MARNRITEKGVLSIHPESIERKIFIIREVKVMLDADLAELYGVSTKNLNRFVQRNLLRFPPDFMFQLSEKDFQNLRCQFGTSSLGYGGRRYMPYAFTELGVAMLSSVLKSDRAVNMNIIIMRTFVKLREMIVTNKDLAYKIGELERNQKEYSEVLAMLHSMIKHLINEPVKKAKPIGFKNT